MIPGLGRAPGEGNINPLQYSSLENPMDREAWRAKVHGVTKSRTRLHFHFHFIYICLENDDKICNKYFMQNSLEYSTLHASKFYRWPHLFK